MNEKQYDEDWRTEESMRYKMIHICYVNLIKHDQEGLFSLPRKIDDRKMNLPHFWFRRSSPFCKNSSLGISLRFWGVLFDKTYGY